MWNLDFKKHIEVQGDLFGKKWQGDKKGNRITMKSPHIVAGNYELRSESLRQMSRKKHFVVLAQTQLTCVQRLNPKNKGVSPYIPLQAGYRSKSKAQPTYGCM
jgi:hypothetical protein